MKKLKPFVVKLENNQVRQRVLGQSQDTVAFRSGQVILNPGEEVGEHSTKDKEEIIVFFEGKAEILSNGHQPVVAHGNSVAYMPPDTKHNVRNIGKSTLRYVYIVSSVKRI